MKIKHILTESDLKNSDIMRIISKLSDNEFLKVMESDLKIIVNHIHENIKDLLPGYQTINKNTQDISEITRIIINKVLDHFKDVNKNASFKTKHFQ